MDNFKPDKTDGLLEKQAKFAVMVSHLIQEAVRLGYTVTLGDAYRDARVHGGQGIKSGYSAAKSAHKWRLAIDLALFRDGRYLTETDQYQPLGDFWKALGGTWGGAWGDGNHFSVTHQGIS